MAPIRIGNAGLTRRDVENLMGAFFGKFYILLKCTVRYLHREFGADHVSPVNNGYAADVS